MATNYNFYFNNLARMGNDSSTNTQRNVFNQKYNNYMLNNLYNQTCNFNNDLVTATSQPNIFVNGSYQVGPNGCNVDTYSDLLFGKPFEATKDRTLLQQRTFLTVPFLGKGNANVVMEQKLRAGDMVKQKKSANQLNEGEFINMHEYPLNSGIKSKVNDSKYCIENDAAEGWVRGGMSTREIYKSSSYSEDVKNKQSLFD